MRFVKLRNLQALKEKTTGMIGFSFSAWELEIAGMSNTETTPVRKPSTDGLDLRPPHFMIDEPFWKGMRIMDIVDSHLIIYKLPLKKTHTLS